MQTHVVDVLKFAITANTHKHSPPSKQDRIFIRKGQGNNTMNFSKFIMTILTGAILISGCASTDHKYYSPSNSPTPSTVAGRQTRHAMTIWENYSFHSVDEKLFDNGFMSNGIESVKTLDPGKHVFVVRVDFNRGSGVFEATTSLTAELEPNKSYKLNGKISDEAITVWLEDSRSGETVPNHASIAWSEIIRSRGTSYIYIPSAR